MYPSCIKAAMLLTHGPFVSLSYTVILFAPFTWASLPPRQAVPISAGAAYSLPSVPTLAPGWSPSPPVWSSPTPASSTTAPVGAYGYPPEPTTCTPWAQCNVFYQVSNFYPITCTCIFISSSGLLCYIGLNPLRTRPASLKQRESLQHRSQPG